MRDRTVLDDIYEMMKCVENIKRIARYVDLDRVAEKCEIVLRALDGVEHEFAMEHEFSARNSDNPEDLIDE